jgi:hypothetical protein
MLSVHGKDSAHSRSAAPSCASGGTLDTHPSDNKQTLSLDSPATCYVENTHLSFAGAGRSQVALVHVCRLLCSPDHCQIAFVLDRASAVLLCVVG